MASIFRVLRKPEIKVVPGLSICDCIVVSYKKNHKGILGFPICNYCNNEVFPKWLYGDSTVNLRSPDQELNDYLDKGLMI